MAHREILQLMAWQCAKPGTLEQPGSSGLHCVLLQLMAWQRAQPGTLELVT